MRTPRIIGLTGLAGSGKDTVRDMLQSDHGFVGLAFADPIRYMLGALLNITGISTHWMHERDLKEQPIPGLGVSYRHMAQTLGTEWGRQLQPDFWLRGAAEHIAAQRRLGATQFVISDVRFVNEAQWLHEMGGEVWRIERPGIEPVRDHESERQMLQIKADRVLDNSGSIEDLWKLVNDVLWDRMVAA